MRSKAKTPSPNLKPMIEMDVYPRETVAGGKPILCQCGGKLMTEEGEAGHLWDRRNNYRVRCLWCPMSTRWFSTEHDAVRELLGGMEIRRSR